MINAPQLLADLTRLLKRLEDDLRQRIAEVAVLKAGLQAEWQAARDADRTAETFESWADQVITQAGVHWLLSCVFLRFIEDNELVERPWLGGTPESDRLALARDRHEAYFRERPLESDRDYLLACFREAGTLPGLHTFFDEAHNPVFRLGVSGDAAMALRQFWQQVDPNGFHVVEIWFLHQPNLAFWEGIEHEWDFTHGGGKNIRALVLCKMKGKLEPCLLKCDFDYEAFTKLTKLPRYKVVRGRIKKVA